MLNSLKYSFSEIVPRILQCIGLKIETVQACSCIVYCVESQLFLEGPGGYA